MNFLTTNIKLPEGELLMKIIDYSTMYIVGSIRNNVGIQLNHYVGILIFKYLISMQPIVHKQVSAHIPIPKRPPSMRLQGYLEIHTKQ